MAWRFYFGNLSPLNISINQSPWSLNQAYLHLCRLDRVVIALPMIPVHPVSKCLVLAPGFSGVLRFISCIWSVFWNLTLGKARWGWSCGRHCTTRPLWICNNRDHWNSIVTSTVRICKKQNHHSHRQYISYSPSCSSLSSSTSSSSSSPAGTIVFPGVIVVVLSAELCPLLGERLAKFTCNQVNNTSE